LQPPIAKKRPVQLTQHGRVRVDDYFWLNQREDPEVIAYLEAENSYTEAAVRVTEGLRQTLFEEIKGRIKQTDETVPYRLDDHWYYTRHEEGKDYALHCRKRGSLDAPEQVMLDLNEMAAGHEFFSVASFRVSSGQNILAYAQDPVGRREYTLCFKNLDTGEVYPDRIPRVSGSMAWANDNRTIFYARKEEGTLRSHRVYRHVLGTDPTGDELVFDETDSTFSCFVFKTKSKRFIFIGSHQTLRTEYRFLEADDPSGEFRVFLPREGKHEYDVDHFGDHFYVRSNEGAENFRLLRTPVDATGKESWEELIAHREDVLLASFDVFRSHLVLVERRSGLRQLRVIAWDGSDDHCLDFGEAAYDAHPERNPSLDTHLLRYEYSSMTTPRSVFDYDMNTREKKLLKQDEVLGGFDASNYVTERLYATARDGVEVPISLVRRRDVESDDGSPLVLYGYGSYGYSLDAAFNASRLSLLDRGFVFAIAHVRGGQEMGRHWYESGKLLHKKNTFFDFIDCAELLVKQGVTRPEKLYAMGGSAGGLLVGAVMNMRPDLFHGVVAQVPFVDVVTTMLDESIPLTTGEFDEWGDPRVEEYYDYILSYSPYDNVAATAYPHLLVMAGLHDSQVQYWEPAKWVAKLRDLKTDDHRLLLKTNMDAGHGGASGRYERYRETAFIYAFLLDLAGLRG
jgi:oligopeptidase B